MLNIVLVSENYANPFKGTIFTTEKQNKSKLKIYLCASLWTTNDQVLRLLSSPKTLKN